MAPTGYWWFMKLFIGLVLWCILFVFSPLLALLALLIFPLLWLVSLPFRLAMVLVEAVFSLLKAVLFLPARILGHRPGR
jgi:hypothetical protein